MKNGKEPRRTMTQEDRRVRARGLQDRAASGLLRPRARSSRRHPLGAKDNTTTCSRKFDIRRWLSLFYALPVLFVLGLCGYMAYRSATHRAPPVRKISAAPFATVKINGLDAHLFAQGDALRASGNDLFIEFRDAQGKLADVGEVSFDAGLEDARRGHAQHRQSHAHRHARPIPHDPRPGPGRGMDGDAPFLRPARPGGGELFGESDVKRENGSSMARKAC
jgi:hypothetical protein